MLAPVIDHDELQQAEVGKQVSPWPHGTIVGARDGTGTILIGDSFTLFVKRKKAETGDTQTQLSGQDLVAVLRSSLDLGKAAPDKHNVLLVCSTQQLDAGLQELLDRSMAEMQPNPCREQPTHAMAVLNHSSHVVGKGGGKEVTMLHVPAGWTVILLGLDASHHLSTCGESALQFVMVHECASEATC